MATKAKELKISELLTKHEAIIEHGSEGDFDLILDTPITPEEINLFVGHYNILYSDHKPEIWSGDDGSTIKITFRQED